LQSEARRSDSGVEVVGEEAASRATIFLCFKVSRQLVLLRLHTAAEVPQFGNKPTPAGSEMTRAGGGDIN